MQPWKICALVHVILFERPLRDNDMQREEPPKF
jgi:hypothetical protein